MKKTNIISIISILFVLTTITAFCGVEVAGEARPFVTEIKFHLNDSPMSAIKYIDSKGVVLIVKDSKGEVLWKSEILGETDKLFLTENKPVNLCVQDVTGDGIPELLVATHYGSASALYVFKYNQETATFEPMSFIHDELEREFMVSDIYQESGHDIVLKKDNSLQALGVVYPDNPLDAPVVAYYHFAIEEDNYKFVSVTPVPEDTH